MRSQLDSAVEVVFGLLLLVALFGAVLVVIGLTRGGVNRIPAVGIVLLLVGGVPASGRFGRARRGLTRIVTRLLPSR